MSEHWPLVAIEIVMVFGGALAFAWWQLRDLDREKRKRLEREARERLEAVEAPQHGFDAAPPASATAESRRGPDAP